MSEVGEAGVLLGLLTRRSGCASSYSIREVEIRKYLVLGGRLVVERNAQKYNPCHMIGGEEGRSS